MDKIIAFFQNKIVKSIAWVLIVLSAIVLIVGGATVQNISSSIALTSGIVTAVSALIAFIAGQIKDL